MGTVLFYIIKSTLCLTILYFLFRLFFRKDTLFRTNRLLLLIGTAACMLVPLLQIDVSQFTPLQVPITTIQHFLTERGVEGSPSAEAVGAGELLAAKGEVAAKEHTGEGDAQSPAGSALRFIATVAATIPVTLLLGGCYLAGVLVVFTSFLLSTIRMRRLISRYPAYDCGAYKLVVCPEQIVSFSWGNTIVLTPEDYERNAEEILLHEQMHLQHRHTLDLLWMECLVTLHWFNPAAWLLMRELREVHEYEADCGVINHGIDATQYQLLLVKKSVGTRLYSMACGFNHSKLKNRITMMLKRRTNRWARLKLLLFVPVAAGTLYAFARPEVKTVGQVMEPVSVEQDSARKSELEELEAFFEQKAESITSRKKESGGEKILGTFRNFFVNMNNKMMLDGEFVVDVEDLSVRLKDILRKDYQKAAKENRTTISALCVRYDRGSSSDAVTSYLRTVKDAYAQVRGEISKQLGGASEEQLDSIFPILVSFNEPNVIGYTHQTAPDVALPLEISFYSQDGSKSSTLKNPTLQDIELKLKTLKSSAGDDKLSVGLKFDKDVTMGMVQDVKGVIRKVAISK